MTNIFFQPWVGINYLKSNKKIFILGESHYCSTGCENCGNSEIESNCNNFTQNIITKYLNYKKGIDNHVSWMNTFTKFTNIMNGKIVNIDELNDFWNSVIFYNYVQKAIKGPRISPSKNDFIQSGLALETTLKTHDPDIMIVWGNRLWKNIPKKNLLIENDNIYYLNENKKIKILKIYHPASTKLTFKYSVELKNILS